MSLTRMQMAVDDGRRLLDEGQKIAAARHEVLAWLGSIAAPRQQAEVNFKKKNGSLENREQRCGVSFGGLITG